MDKIPEKSEDTEKKEEKAPEDSKDKKEEKKDKLEIIGGYAIKGLEMYYADKQKKGENDTAVRLKELELKENIMKEKLKLLEERLKEQEEKEKKKKQEEEEKKNKVKNGMKEWNKKEKELIEKFLKEIDIDLIKKIMENNNLNIINQQEFDYEFNRIFTQQLQNNEIIREKHNSIFQSIKDNLKGIQSLNFLIAGFSGAGKSTLTNAILKFDEAEEGEGIDPQTGAIKPYSNPDVVPGIMIYDTIGVETTSVDRNLAQIKKGIEATFDKYLKDPEKSLHGILYCIKNGAGDHRIEEGEIKFIKALNKIYGDGDILIIVFTQSTNQDTQIRKSQLKEKLNNPNIEIIEVIAKGFKFQVEGKMYEIKPKGLENLIDAMKKKCQKQLVKCNIKQIAKKSIQEKFYNDIQKKSFEVSKKINEYDLANTFGEECRYILTNLICDLDLNYENLSHFISKVIDISKKEIKNKLLDEYKERWEIKLFKEFNLINNEYDKQLDNSSINDDLMDEFNEYFSNNIEGYIKKLFIAKASLMFIEKIKVFFGGLICDDIRDEEIADIVRKSLENIFNKINNANNN